MRAGFWRPPGAIPRTGLPPSLLLSSYPHQSQTRRSRFRSTLSGIFRPPQDHGAKNAGTNNVASKAATTRPRISDCHERHGCRAWQSPVAVSDELAKVRQAAAEIKIPVAALAGNGRRRIAFSSPPGEKATHDGIIKGSESSCIQEGVKIARKWAWEERKGVRAGNLPATLKTLVRASMGQGSLGRGGERFALQRRAQVVPYDPQHHRGAELGHVRRMVIFLRPRARRRQRLRFHRGALISGEGLEVGRDGVDEFPVGGFLFPLPAFLLGGLPFLGLFLRLTPPAFSGRDKPLRLGVPVLDRGAKVSAGSAILSGFFSVSQSTISI